MTYFDVHMRVQGPYTFFQVSRLASVNTVFYCPTSNLKSLMTAGRRGSPVGPVVGGPVGGAMQ